jgi:hypothetical protein
MVDVTVRTTRHQILKAPKSVIIKVGILGGRIHAPKAKGKKSTEPVPMAKLIAWLEAGFAFKARNGKKITVPPRPILAPGIEKGWEGIQKGFKQLSAALIEGGTGDAEIAKVASFTVGKIQEYVDGDLPGIAPNAESTIKNKGTSAGAGGNTPMIDTGELVAALTYASEKS